MTIKIDEKTKQAIERALDNGEKLELYALKDKRLKIRKVKYSELQTEYCTFRREIAGDELSGANL